jgi:class 3 adenylate cyclase/predicted ATPase
MRCASCDSENPDSKRFCGDCGLPLGSRCARCGVENPVGKKFCGDCGADLSEPRAALRSAESTAAPVVGEHGEQHEVPLGERRHLTVLFCDLVGSTEIASHLDPEAWREIVGEYHRAAAQAIERFGGHVAQYLGDGVMAYFGWPEAHDNDAERAARAGLAILEAITKLNEHRARPKLAARVGIDSGTVVVGAGAGKDSDVFGDTPNIAARVQAAAEPDTVMITDATQRLVSGLFIVEDCGTQRLKGLERPITLYRVDRPSGARGRFEATAAAGALTPFVGREEELRSLQSRWERALEGEGQMALIIGEAGIGKSRLLQRFHEQIAGTPHTWIESGAGTFFQNTPFYSVIEMLRQFLGNGTAQDQLAQLASRLTVTGLKPAEAIPLIAPLLNLPLPAEYPPFALSPEQQRRRLLATLVEWVLGSARAQPLVIATEDLHWADPSTQELIQLLVEQGATARLLLLHTARPEFRPSWTMRAHHMQITLNRLSARDVRTMVGEVAAQKALSAKTVAAVVERTGGVPLFVEELTRAVLESGNAKLTGREIPATLHDSLLARLDRLGAAKEVVQVGAVLGSDFSYELLHAVHPMAEADLQRALRSLTDAELLYVRGIAPEATYQFKHALIRDAAYEALLKSRSKELHLRVAHAIDENFPIIKEAHPEVLARHWAEAGNNDKAVKYFQLAGARAVERGALVEAERNYIRALELLSELPENAERDRYELELQLAVGPALIVLKGWAVPQVERAYTRARELCERLGDSPELFPALFGMWAMYLVRGELRTSYELAEQLLRLAQSAHDPALHLLAQTALGHTSYWMGKFLPARKHLETAFSNYDPECHRTLALNYLGIDTGVYCLCGATLTLCQLGHPDQALKLGNKAITLSNPVSLPYAELFVGFMRQYRREVSAALEMAESVIALSVEHGLSTLVPAIILRGWATAEQGCHEERIARLQKGLARCRGAKFELFRPYFLCLLAEACLETGRLDDGLSALTEALVFANKNEEREHEAEIHRLKGELLLKQNDSNVAQAPGCFERAIEIARKQSAKSLELRATMSLARLLAKQDRRDEARAMLAEIYGWFTEGFDTADLKDAKALLDELGA